MYFDLPTKWGLPTINQCFFCCSLIKDSCKNSAKFLFQISHTLTERRAELNMSTNGPSNSYILSKKNLLQPTHKLALPTAGGISPGQVPRVSKPRNAMQVYVAVLDQKERQTFQNNHLPNFSLILATSSWRPMLTICGFFSPVPLLCVGVISNAGNVPSLDASKESAVEEPSWFFRLR